MPTLPERNDASPPPSLAAELIPRVGHLEADVSQLKVDVAHLQTDVAQLKVDVAEIKATLPHLATKADLAPIVHIMAVIPHMATKADLATLESRLIRWMVGSWIAMAGVMTAVVTAAVRFAH
jgi:hypothetical protein